MPFFSSQFFNFTVFMFCVQFPDLLEGLSIQKVLGKTGISLCSTFSLISIRMSRLLSARNLLATHPHPPRPIQIQGMPIGHLRSHRRRKSLRENKNIDRTVSVSVVRQTSKSFTDHPTLPMVGNIHEIPGSIERELKTEFVLFLSPQTFPSLCIHRAPVLKAGLA